MNKEPQRKFEPQEEPLAKFDRKAMGRFESDLYNLAYERDMARKRNVLYIGLLIVCVLATVWVATTANYKTYVVRVDNATGQVEAGQQLKATNYKPQEAEIKAFLVQFVNDTRLVPKDPVTYRSNWNHAKHFMTNEALNKYSAISKNENVSQKLGRYTVQPTIKSIQLQPGTKSTYQVRWVEEEFAQSGTTTGKLTSYMALLNVMLDPPKKESELLINPLGLKIQDISMTIENETTIQAPKPTNLDMQQQPQNVPVNGGNP
ncbi:MAG: type IV secretion system protein [Schwartzia succinivorans]|uniref:type IV secretion system protein n=1 Tax=Schwartzia succinivorans TaxID=55507 RepID=UPI002354E26A|nr:type IV secretion system protein [Schwartzia succinivorans]MBE6096360.1 type IV secretion system protein [Schwartzia succinivorans]